MADKKGENYPQLPTAPQGGQHFQQDPNLFHRPPPPSYEESQRWNPQPMFAPQGGNFYPAMSGNPPPYSGIHLQQQQQHQPMQYAPQHGIMGYGLTHPQYAFNYSPQQQMMPAAAVGTSQQPMVSGSTVTYDAGARFKGQGAGSISIPPPPPGCAPTPEQLAALQGQPVILKKKKNSFF